MRLRNPFRQRTRVEKLLDDELKWMSESLSVIRETNPEAAWRLAQNIQDRLRLRPRDENPLDTPRDLIDIVESALEAEWQRLGISQ